ncbi:MAG: NAD-dependent epimerase/dehydratase family protein [Chloroflexi bacterium]|nr:NAD-dependent epimerase/dehydratase family protein [Chloroflexota bacterium]
MFDPKRKVLVTGGAGFTGNHLAQRLLADGQEVRTLVRDPQKLPEHQAASLDVVVGDVRDPEACLRAVQGCDIVYHVAASFRSGKATASELIDINANGTRNMLDAAEKAGVSRFVHCSTIGVLGHVETPPANEDTPYNPCDDYQYSKMQGEQIAWSTLVRVASRYDRAPASIYGKGICAFSSCSGRSRRDVRDCGFRGNLTFTWSMSRTWPPASCWRQRTQVRWGKSTSSEASTRFRSTICVR